MGRGEEGWERMGRGRGWGWGEDGERRGGEGRGAEGRGRAGRDYCKNSNQIFKPCSTRVHRAQAPHNRFEGVDDRRTM